MNSMSTQEVAVGIIVFAAAFWILWTNFIKYFGSPTSLWLINHGHTRMGFWIKKRLPNAGCANCSCPTSEKTDPFNTK